MNQPKALKRVLLVAYLFPPVGGAGVQRAAKFVKYLPEHGWLPSVLTAANPSVPVFDESLLADIPSETIVRRARTLEPGYALKNAVSASGETAGGEAARLERVSIRRMLKSAARTAANVLLQPDSQVLWWPGAVREGMRLLREVPHQAIMVTAPPFSSFLVGAALSRRTGLPLILDYRDEWDISSAYWENKQKGRCTRWVQTRMQNFVVRRASRLIATTRHSAASLVEVAARAGSRAEVAHIYNGYDADDFPNVVPAAPGDSHRRFRVTYIGTLWNLTSVDPLVQAVEKLSATAPELAERLELQFAGRRTAPQDALLDRLEGLPCKLTRLPYVDHQQAVELMRSADMQCVLMSDVPHAGRVMPAKVFEYLATRRPILAIAPAGEVGELLRDCPLACHHLPADVSGLANTLAGRIEQHRLGLPDLQSLSSGATVWDPSRYERRTLAAELAAVLDEVAGEPHRARACVAFTPEEEAKVSP